MNLLPSASGLRAPSWGPLLLALAMGCTAVARADGVIERVKLGGPLVIAHRESSVPFSYVLPGGRAQGYALDLCLKVAEALRRKTGMKDMPVELVLVNTANRIEMLERGMVDMECGSTTNNAERRTRVAFTIPHFITGARLLVKASSKVERIEDLRGKTLVSTRNTTPLQAAEQANRERLLGMRIVAVAEHARAVEMVEQGEAEAFLMDDVLLFGLAANRPHPGGLKVVGKFMTTEPLAIMLPRNDPEFKRLVDEEMRRLIASRDIHALYDKWFMKPIPPRNTALNLPVSYLLRDFWKYPTDVVPF